MRELTGKQQEVLGFIRTFLLVFAYVALVVGAPVAAVAFAGT